MEQNPDDMQNILQTIDSMQSSRPQVDLKTYDYQALGKTIVDKSFWVLQLEALGHVDSTGKAVDPSRLHTTTGTRPTFMLYCYDEKARYRISHQCIGLPDSDTVLE